MGRSPGRLQLKHTKRGVKIALLPLIFTMGCYSKFLWGATGFSKAALQHHTKKRKKRWNIK